MPREKWGKYEDFCREISEKIIEFGDVKVVKGFVDYVYFGFSHNDVRCVDGFVGAVLRQT